MIFTFLACVLVSEQDLQDRLALLEYDTSLEVDPPIPDDTAPQGPEDTAIEDTAIEDTAIEDTAITEPCSEVTRIEFSIEFPPTEGCLWNEFGNNPPEQGRIQARTENTVIFSPPENQQICNVYFDFESQFGGKELMFGFDDQLLMVVNQHVIFSSHKDFMTYFDESNNSFLYDWGSLRGKEMLYETDYWLLGVNSQAFFPPPEEQVVGNSFLEIDSTALGLLRTQIVEENHIDIQLVTLGDNDETDCFHHAFITKLYIDIYEP